MNLWIPLVLFGAMWALSIPVEMAFWRGAQHDRLSTTRVLMSGAMFAVGGIGFLATLVVMIGGASFG